MTAPRESGRPRRGGKGLPGLAKLLAGAGCLLVLAAYLGNRRHGTDAPPPAPALAETQLPGAGGSDGHGDAVILKPGSGGGPARITDARLAVDADGRTLRIEGDIGPRFAGDLEQALAATPALQRIVITSGGGYAGPGLEAARLIRRRNLTVRVRSYCASMCVGLWAAAAARELEPDAVIGLHQWRTPCATLAPEERRECEYSAQFWTQHDTVYDAWLRSAGFNQHLLDLQANTPADQVAVLAAPQLWDNGVDFAVPDATGRPMSREQVRTLLAAKYGRGG
ncbi:hypothetical protein [Xanthomonas massiliensis]|uniref:hypothetical protein n=1 Tax=Xanthomonas massiliensis TaxID=1720302 RepID=UPI000825B57D|nr:hypothetical protein [Xanthomonas massiliensis]